MNSIQNKNNLVSYLLFVLCLFVLIFFTKNLALQAYTKWQETKQLELTQVESRQEWERYTQLKEDLEAGTNQDSLHLEKYATEFSQDGFVEFIYDYIESTRSASVIKTLTFSEPFENEIGFTQVDVDMNLNVPSLAAMGQILTYLISDEAKYKIFITDFSFPNSDDQGDFNVNIPLKIFYK